jgi:hypothetical protein
LVDWEMSVVTLLLLLLIIMRLLLQLWLAVHETLRSSIINWQDFTICQTVFYISIIH